jgi:hypothetical protein
LIEGTSSIPKELFIVAKLRYDYGHQKGKTKG